MPDQIQTQYPSISLVKGRSGEAERDLNQPRGIKKHPLIMPLFRLLGVLAVTSIMGFAAFFASGILSAFSANITNLNGVTYFDPLITLTYLIFFYFLNNLFSFTNKQRGYYFLLTLFLSYTINFVEGSILLLILFPTLRFLKLVEKQS